MDTVINDVYNDRDNRRAASEANPRRMLKTNILLFLPGWPKLIMDMYLRFFLSGLALGAGACGIHCSILLAPVIAKGSANWKEGVRTGLLFGAGKILVYGIFGGIASYSGYLMQSLINREVFALAGGTALVIMAFWFFFSRGKCGRLFKIGPPFLMGLLEGVFPCPVTLGFVVYVAHEGGGALFGILAGVLFGLGTITGPLLAVCGAIPYLWRRLSRFSGAGLVLRLTGSAIFFVWGVSLLLQGL